ncbi:MAG: hypothetical protein SF051_12560 [Elusimicrobiota bacterium]|nr:hypothetical protein [Elusimicrobiota bacterium]
MRTALLAVLLLSGAVASATQFALPLHAPPRLRARPGEPGLRLGLGWTAVRGPDLALEGPGGGWELAAMSEGGLGGHLHADAFALSGQAAPLQGSRRATGMTGTMEGDASWSPDGPDGAVRVYAGGAVNLTMLSFTGAGRVTVGGGGLVVEPDTAVSLVAGLPFGVALRRRLGEDWSLDAALSGAAWLGGKTFFTYGPAGPLSRGSTRKVDPNLGGGARLLLEHLPSRLALEGGVSAAAAAGNNDGHAFAWAQLALHLF